MNKIVFALTLLAISASAHAENGTLPMASKPEEVGLSSAQLKRLDRQWPPLGFAKAPRTDEKGAKRLAAKASTIATGYYLQIQPDGTVKLLPSYEAAGATGAPK